MATEILEKILFDYVNNLGEVQNEYFQIIDISDSVDTIFGEKKFKVYHSNGYCFDVEKKNLGQEDKNTWLGFDYIVYDDWDGFKKGSIQLYCKLLS